MNGRVTRRRGDGKEGKSIVAGSTSSGLSDWYRQHKALTTGFTVLAIAALATVVPVAVYRSLAATATASFEAEGGTAIVATVGNDTTASNGKFIQFANVCPTGQVGTPPNCTSGGGFAWPKSVSSNGRYLLDQNGQPYLVNGDSPHTIAYFRSVSEADQFFANRQSYGVNAAWVEVICDQYISCDGISGPSVEGYSPFKGTNNTDLSQPNEQFFAKLDQVVQAAANHGVTLFLTPVETGNWSDIISQNGTTKCFNYGVYLGNRYKNFPNIVWQHGNDYFGGADAAMMAIYDGIKSVDTNHLGTLEMYPQISSTLDQQQWASRVNINESYTYYVTYDENLHAYNQTPVKPMLMVEAGYEYEAVGGRSVQNTPATLRRQEYWTMTTGATGQLYGNGYTWNEKDWATEQAHLNSPGIIQLGYMYNFFKILPWYNLVPDQTHAFLTAGYGTYDNSTTSDKTVTNDYATAALTADGGTGVLYTPVAHTLTVNMAKMKSSTTARWFDPTNNTFQTVSGSPLANSGTHQFATPGNNSAGNGDWVLLLQAN